MFFRDYVYVGIRQGRLGSILNLSIYEYSDLQRISIRDLKS